MKRRSTTGLVLAILFTLGNIAGGVYAAIMGEPRHAILHAALTLLGGWIAWQITEARREPALVGLPLPSGRAGGAGELAVRLNNLEQSIDAIAVEVERVGEAQRFMTGAFTKRREGEPDRR